MGVIGPMKLFALSLELLGANKWEFIYTLEISRLAFLFLLRSLMMSAYS